ncbi:MAG: hypothetical protein J6T94_02215 [Bacteroidaceae bacterium]|nr:hypothetical protein [Bacteroidaceae bacterium]
MMEIVHFDVPLNSNSRDTIWNVVGTIEGMSAWLADSITEEEGIYTFTWGKHETRKAELISRRLKHYVRFHWLDDDPKTYFELRINQSELTHNYSLEVTELSTEEDAEGLQQLWEAYTDKLHRTTGI